MKTKLVKSDINSSVTKLILIFSCIYLFSCRHTVHQDGLIAYWAFDENRGNTTRCLNSALNGISDKPERTDGALGKAYRFTGSNPVMINNSNLNLNNMFTIMFWVKTSPSGNNQVLLSKGSVNDEGHFSLYIQDKGFIKFRANGITPVGCGIVVDDQWHHVAVTYNGTDLKVYLDSLDHGGPIYTFIDIPEFVRVSGSIPSSTDTLMIGSETNGRDPFTGLLDELKIFNRELTREEILHDLTSVPYATRQSWVTRDTTGVIKDPVWTSCKDGCLLYNPIEKNWWYFYMQIRNGSENGTVDHYGTTIGSSRSNDHGRTWEYVGTMKGLYIDPGMNTVWAPDISWDDSSKMFHGFVSYTKGVHGNYLTTRENIEQTKTLNHYVSYDLVNWKYVKGYNFSQRNIDCTVRRMPDGKWGMWYKDEAPLEPGSGDLTGFATGYNLYDFKFHSWVDKYTKKDGRRGTEGPEIFRWRGYYWLLGDHRKDQPPVKNGIRIYRSEDCYNWKLMPVILALDDTYLSAHHPEAVIVNDSLAYLYINNYTSFRHHGYVNDYCITLPTLLEFDGESLVVDRSKKFQVKLPDYFIN